MMNKYLKYLIKVLISSLIILTILLNIDRQEFFFILKKTSIPIFIFATFLSFFASYINAKKWKSILNYQGFKAQTFFLLKLNLISSFYASFLPGGQVSGEGVKCYKICKNKKNKNKLILSVLADKISGLFGFFVIGLLGIYLTKNDISQINKLKLLFLTLNLCPILTFAFLSSKKYTFHSSLKYEKITLLFNLLNKLKHSPYIFLASLFYSVFYQFIIVIIVKILAYSVNIEISVFDSMWITALMNLVSVIPITLLGIGLREISLISLLGFIGITPESSLSISTLFLLVILSNALCGGVIEIVSTEHKNKKLS